MNNSSLPSFSSTETRDIKSILKNEESETERQLPPLKNFFGNKVTFGASVEHSRLALQYLKEKETLLKQPRPESEEECSWLKRIKELNDKASLHTFLAEEAFQEAEENQLTSKGSIATQLTEAQLEVVCGEHMTNMDLSNEAHEDRRSNTQSPLPLELSSPFVSDRKENNVALWREQHSLFKTMRDYEEKAAYYKRQVKYQEKMLALAREYGTLERVKYQEEYIAFFQEKVVDCLTKAQQIHEQIYGYTTESPGAYRGTHEGGYELESPVIAPVPAVQAYPVHTPSLQEWRQLRRGKLETPPQGEPLPQVTKKGTSTLVKAKKVEFSEIEASFPKNIKLPEAQVHKG